MSSKKPILLITKSKSSLTDKKEQEKTKQKLEEEQIQREIQKTIAVFEKDDSTEEDGNSHNNQGNRSRSNKTMTWVRGGVFQQGNSTTVNNNTHPPMNNNNNSGPDYNLPPTITTTTTTTEAINSISSSSSTASSLYYQQIPSNTTSPPTRSSLGLLQTSPLVSSNPLPLYFPSSSSTVSSVMSLTSTSSSPTTSIVFSRSVTTSQPPSTEKLVPVPTLTSQVHSSSSVIMSHKSSVFQADDDDDDEENTAARIAAAAIAHQQKKLKEMNNFMDELKHKQNDPHRHNEDEERQEKGFASSTTEDTLHPDTGNSTDVSHQELSTNIHVGHLPPNITEEDLLQLFQKYGKIISIKIMWPRKAEEKARGFNSGFVLFQNRKEAENALRTLQKYTINDQYNNPVTLKLGWAKAVKTSNTTTALRVGPHGTVTMTTTAELLQDNVKPIEGSLSSTVEVNTTTLHTTEVSLPYTFLPVSTSPNVHPAVPTIMVTDDSRLPLQSLYDSLPPPESLLTLPSIPSMPKDTVPFSIDLPVDPIVRKLIDTWAPYVARDGQTLETVLINRVHQFIQEYFHYEKTKEQHNAAILSGGEESSLELPDRNSLLFPEPYTPDHFYWLTETDLPDSHYYRWRVYSILQGDTLTRWRTEPFQYQQNGSWWLPPEFTKNTIGNDDEIDETNMKDESNDPDKNTEEMEDEVDESFHRKRRRNQADSIDDVNLSNTWSTKGPKLPSHLKEELDDMLRTLTVERFSICDGMVFIIQNAEYAQDIVKQLIEDIVIVTDPMDINRMLTVLIARLYLISDVLHNAGMTTVHNSSSYRIIFQTVLPDLLEIYGNYYALLGGRASRTAFRERIIRIFASWNDRSIYPPLYIQGLESTLVRSVECNLAKLSVPTSSESSIEERKRQCKFAGVSSKGSIEELEYRLLWLQVYTHNRFGELIKTNEPSNEDTSVPQPLPADNSQPSTSHSTRSQRIRRSYASKLPLSAWVDLPEGSEEHDISEDDMDNNTEGREEAVSTKSNGNLQTNSVSEGITIGTKKKEEEKKDEEEEDIDGIPLTPEMVQAWTKYRINLALNKYNVQL